MCTTCLTVTAVFRLWDLLVLVALWVTDLTSTLATHTGLMVVAELGGPRTCIAMPMVNCWSPAWRCPA